MPNRVGKTLRNGSFARCTQCPEFTLAAYPPWGWGLAHPPMPLHHPPCHCTTPPGVIPPICSFRKFCNFEKIKILPDFATKIPQLMDIIFGNVEGWPGIKNPSVKQFILDHQITATGWYVGFPHLTVNDIRRNDKIIKGLNKAIDEANKI